MSRLPTNNAVRLIIDTDLQGPDVDAFIDDADAMTARCLSGQPDGVVRTINKWVAAHLIYSSGRGGDGQGLTSQRLGDASESYQRGQLGMGLSASYYGQQALALDPTGCLATLHLRRAGFTVL